MGVATTKRWWAWQPPRGGGRVRTHVLAEAEEGTEEGEGERDAEPEEEQGQEGGEGDGRRGPRPPQEEVECEEDGEDDAGNKESGHEHVRHPAETTHH